MKRAVFLTLVLALGLLARAYQFPTRFVYAHDNDLAGWVVKDIVVDRHLRLIGQLTSAPGIFIGPLFYYALIPFYLLTNFDPIGTIVFSWLVGLAAIASVYWIANYVWGRPVGAIAAVIYAVSFGIAVNEREVVPTTPVMLWSVWFFYAVHLLFAKNNRSLWLFAVLIPLIWHLNLALVLLLPLVVAGVVIGYRKWDKKTVIGSLCLFLALNLPLVLFEARHNFQQTRALIQTLAPSGEQASLLTKLDKAVTYANRNLSRIFWWDQTLSPVWLVLIGALPWFTWIWLCLYIGFFTLHSLPLSEYYLNGLNILWVFAAAIVLHRMGRWPAAVLLTLFVAYNLSVNLAAEASGVGGYQYKKQLIAFIQRDVAERGYPCLAASFITDQGYEFGYRYWFWLYDLKLKLPGRTNVPVYSIVFPHSKVDRLDRTFGPLGLILPEYSRYNRVELDKTCSGENVNLTEPMFGFTK